MLKLNSLLLIMGLFLLSCGEPPVPADEVEVEEEINTQVEEPAEVPEQAVAPLPEPGSEEQLTPAPSEESAPASVAPQSPMPELVISPDPSPSSTGTTGIVVGQRYNCDGNRAYILHEPGQVDPNRVCELDALHTTKPADWNARGSTNYCRRILERKIADYNCTL